MDEPAPRARDALGMPVPPSWASRAAERTRAGIGHVHDRMAPPFGLLLDRLFGMIDAKALHAAVTFRIPDRLADAPLTSAQLAEADDFDADALERVLAYLASRGFFRRDGEGRFANTPTTEILREDHPFSWRDWALFIGSDWSWEIWNQLPDRVRTGAPATELAFGESFFDYVNRTNPDARDAFNGAMAAGSRIQAMLFAEAIDFGGVRSVCDVGGGSGSVIAHVLRVHAHLSGVVYDLPALAGDARRVFADAGVADRASFAGGDFFEAVPEGHDLYTMFAVVHDWGDGDCVRILSNVRHAMGRRGRLLVVERPLGRSGNPDFARASDLLMLVYGEGGRERTVAEYEALAAGAGLVVRSRTTLASLFEVFELGS
jgi:hypothetical protein